MDSNDSDKNTRVNVDSIVLVVNQPEDNRNNFKKLHMDFITPRTVQQKKPLELNNQIIN